ncbi:unnamed protein product [Spirodela intermedia]|uniref:Uncharacterized protein n=1 Tax=Spirodela intermedia TaxID=51605 RepID=A0A7I8ILC4_SPIIN|nr:unnamed protein product [Spirodela intermedia]CAA6657972.1 unnamed protein product [Spirodela intermedia]
MARLSVSRVLRPCLGGGAAAFSGGPSLGYSAEEPLKARLSSALRSCCCPGDLPRGRQIHAQIIVNGIPDLQQLQARVLGMYMLCGKQDSMAWNWMIRGSAMAGLFELSLLLYFKMFSYGVAPDRYTFLAVLRACVGLRAPDLGSLIHETLVSMKMEADPFLGSSLIKLYADNGLIGHARKVFDGILDRDSVLWNVMIDAYVRNRNSREALTLCWAETTKLFEEMPPGFGPVAWNGMISGYAQNGMEEEAVDFLRRMQVAGVRPDSVNAVSAMISGYVLNGYSGGALAAFRELVAAEMKPNAITIASVLPAWGGGDLRLHHHLQRPLRLRQSPVAPPGTEIHGHMLRRRRQIADIFTESALVDMYAKCGDLAAAGKVFDAMEAKNEVSWNSIIAAYGSHGHLPQAVVLFEGMLAAGFLPDHVTFLSLLSACGHAGEVERGFQFFRRMAEEFAIAARMEHYACMVDLFGRAGRLEEAMRFIQAMPFPADAGVWGALLGACRMHGGATEFAELASQHLLRLDPCNSGYYVLMANVHAVAGRWEGASKVRNLMKERRVQKPPGCSWIKMAGGPAARVFVAADTAHPECPMIYSLLRVLLLQLGEEGYVPQTSYL